MTKTKALLSARATTLGGTMTNLPATRKWLIRREGTRPWHGWIVTAPSGQRRWFYTWPTMEALCPFFVMGEQSPGLRDLAPDIYDAGVRI